MFAIFLTSVFTVFIVFSILFAYTLKTVFPRFIESHVYIKVFLFNIVLLWGLCLSNFLPVQIPRLWFLQQLIIVMFVSEILFSAVNIASKFIMLAAEFIRRNNINAPVDESRRKFLMKAALLPVEGAVLYGSFIEKNDIILNKYTIKIKNADSMHGLKIAQLTDAHIGSFFPLERLRETLDRLAALHPDILAVTGDIFDDDNINKQAVVMLNEYCPKFKYGVYFCWGNHEYLRNIRSIKESLRKTSIKVLTNRNITLDIADKKLSIIGVDYPQDRSRFSELAAEYMEEAVKGIPDGSVKILLAHHSDFIDNAFADNVDLALTGHTHGGQIGIFGHPLFQGFKYVRGMFYRNGLYGYVSTGAGSWFPFRLGCPPEITLFTLE